MTSKIAGLDEILETLDFGWIDGNVTARIYSGNDEYYIHFNTFDGIEEPYLRGAPIRNAKWQLGNLEFSEATDEFRKRFMDTFRTNLANRYIALSNTELNSPDTNVKTRTYTVKIIAQHIDRALLVSTVGAIIGEMASKSQ